MDKLVFAGEARATFTAVIPACVEFMSDTSIRPTFFRLFLSSSNNFSEDVLTAWQFADASALAVYAPTDRLRVRVHAYT